MKSEKVLLEALETIASDDWDEDEVLVKASNPDGTPVFLHPSDIARRALDAWGELCEQRHSKHRTNVTATHPQDVLE